MKKEWAFLIVVAIMWLAYVAVSLAFVVKLWGGGHGC